MKTDSNYMRNRALMLKQPQNNPKTKPIKTRKIIVPTSNK